MRKCSFIFVAALVLSLSGAAQLSACLLSACNSTGKPAHSCCKSDKQQKSAPCTSCIKSQQSDRELPAQKLMAHAIDLNLASIIPLLMPPSRYAPETVLHSASPPLLHDLVHSFCQLTV